MLQKCPKKTSCQEHPRSSKRILCNHEGRSCAKFEQGRQRCGFSPSIFRTCDNGRQIVVHCPKGTECKQVRRYKIKCDYPESESITPEQTPKVTEPQEPTEPTPMVTEPQEPTEPTPMVTEPQESTEPTPMVTEPQQTTDANGNDEDSTTKNLDKEKLPVKIITHTIKFWPRAFKDLFKF